MGKSLADELAEAAWHVLNHDNDPHDGQEHNTANWKTLCDSIKDVLKRRKHKNHDHPKDQTHQ